MNNRECCELTKQALESSSGVFPWEQTYPLGEGGELGDEFDAEGHTWVIVAIFSMSSTVEGVRLVGLCQRKDLIKRD